MIKIIKDLDITASGVSVFNRKWQPVHLQQGEMDGACAVYSMMMNLLILKVLTRNQVVNLKTTFKGNTAKGRLFKEFFVTEGLCRDGFYFSDTYPTYMIQIGANHQEESWQLVFLLDRNQKIDEIVVHKNCCNSN